MERFLRVLAWIIVLGLLGSAGWAAVNWHGDIARMWSQGAAPASIPARLA